MSIFQQNNFKLAHKMFQCVHMLTYPIANPCFPVEGGGGGEGNFGTGKIVV